MALDVRSLTTNALAVALTAAATMALRVPVPATQGYINLGETRLQWGGSVRQILRTILQPVRNSGPSNEPKPKAQICE